jgi:hypothetical protein
LMMPTPAALTKGYHTRQEVQREHGFSRDGLHRKK